MNLTATITDMEKIIDRMTVEEAYREWQYREVPSGDLMDKMLCRAATGLIDLPDTNNLARTLLTLALDRAYDVMLMDMIECDEDHCDVLVSEFRARQRNFRRALAEIAVRGPMSVAETSQWIVGGSSDERTRRGAKHPLILAAWELVQRAVKDTYPLAYEKARKTHRTAYEKFAERALERSA